ncbi:MAG: phosphoribosylformylglycinamidine synthase subunit PurQ [Polyangiaceae bacterium]
MSLSPSTLEQLETFDALPTQQRAERRRAVRVLVLTGLGLNCEAETVHAFQRVGASPETVHLLDLLETPGRLLDYQILAFIGGFAFGDHLGAGFVFANKIRYRMYDELLAFIDRGGLALGVCNGFQTMTRLGMLPGLDGDYRTPRATLGPNDRPGYRDAWVRLRFDATSPCVWTRGIDTLELPARHGEGKLLFAEGVRERVESASLVAARYVDESLEPTEAWPANPNGSPGGAAGLCDPTGRLFGLMPHPDAYLFPFQHPNWPRARARGEAAEAGGLAIFQRGVDAAAAFSR